MAREEQQPLKLGTFVAGADLSALQYTFVKLSGDAVIAVAAATDVPIGVLQNKPIAGGACEIVVVGVTKLVASAALATIGTQIGTTATGTAVAVAAGAPTLSVLGRTLSIAGGAAELITVIINCIAPALAVTAN